MQYTTNYNLITVEGTDVVNPLVQMNPNFTDIDAAMFANKQATIGTATEITVGTVHSITRANTDSDYFRFTATSNWTAGDSMSVDGVNVSVYLSDGTSPSTGAYVINTEVFALLSGTRLTLITSNGTVTIAATDVTYDNTVSGLAASDVQDAIDELADIQKVEFATYTLGVGETYKDGLDRVYADLVTKAGSDLIKVLYLEMPGAVIPSNDISIKQVDTKYDFTASIPQSASQIIINSVETKSGASNFTRATLDGSVTMRSFNTDSAAGTFKIAFNRFA